jgi:hypothetical protein
MQHQVQADTAGKLTINLASRPLGCDSVNADYAFTVNTLPQLRMGTSLYSMPEPEHPGRLMNFSVYPNPGTGVFEVIPQFEKGSSAECRIFIHDTTGRQVIKASSSGSFRADLQGAAPGIYFITMVAGTEKMVKKLVKY